MVEQNVDKSDHCLFYLIETRIFFFKKNVTIFDNDIFIQ